MRLFIYNVYGKVALQHFRPPYIALLYYIDAYSEVGSLLNSVFTQPQNSYNIYIPTTEPKQYREL